MLYYNKNFTENQKIGFGITLGTLASSICLLFAGHNPLTLWPIWALLLFITLVKGKV